MVFGAFSLYLSVVLYLNSILGLACLTVFMGLLIVLVKLWEEKRLLKDFGAEYTEYKKKVPMFFPGLRIKKR
jgi:protein-S-isoprenylcysteine O-methyltransferase Ste14